MAATESLPLQDSGGACQRIMLEHGLCPSALRTLGGVVLCGRLLGALGADQHPWPHPLNAGFTPSCDKHRCPQTWPGVPEGQDSLR